MLNILAGPNLQQFRIHRGLLAALSEEMRQLVYKGAKEGSKEQAGDSDLKLPEASEEIMAYLSEFCYTGDYNADSGMWDHCRLKPGTTSHATENTEDQEKALVHARLYVFAKRYNIEALQVLAMDSLLKFMANATIEGVGLIPCLVGYALGNIPEAQITDRLVVFLAKCTAWVTQSKSTSSKQFHRLLASVSRKDFFTVFCEYMESDNHYISRPW